MYTEEITLDKDQLKALQSPDINLSTAQELLDSVLKRHVKEIVDVKANDLLSAFKNADQATQDEVALLLGIDGSSIQSI